MAENIGSMNPREFAREQRAKRRHRERQERIARALERVGVSMFDHLRSALLEPAFRPFVIHTESGLFYEIEEPGQVALCLYPELELIAIQDGEGLNIVAWTNIVAIKLM